MFNLINRIEDNMTEFMELYEKGVIAYNENLYGKLSVHTTRELLLDLIKDKKNIEVKSEYFSEEFPQEAYIMINNIKYFTIFTQEEFNEFSKKIDN